MCQKTVTVDLFTHKCVKNNGLEPQYFIEGHHQPIIEKKDWLLAQQIRKERRYVKNKSTRRKPRVVMRGNLAGFIIADANWSIEDVDNILDKASMPSESIPTPALVEDENFKIEKE